MQAVGWMSIAWHTVMPCAVFIVAYGRIFFTVRRLHKIKQTAPAAAAAAAAQHSVAPMTAVENPGRSEAATSVQPGPTRPGGHPYQYWPRSTSSNRGMRQS